MSNELLFHTIEPVSDSNSCVLLLGTFPSPKSREQGFYYGHPQNRFWTVLSTVLNSPYPETIEDRKDLLLQNRIALWDVLSCCTIQGASDASIRDFKPNPIDLLLKKTKIHTIFATGSKAHQLYQKLIFPSTCLAAVRLPSTSPANCRMPISELTAAYQAVVTALDAEGSS